MVRRLNSSSMTLLFADPAVRSLIQCHTFEDHEWFNRERFIILLHWLVIAEMLEIAIAAGPDLQEPPPVRHGKLVHRLQGLADAAAYRMDRFFSMLDSEKRS